MNPNRDERMRTSGGAKENGKCGEMRGKSWPGNTEKGLEMRAKGNQRGTW